MPDIARARINKSITKRVVKPVKVTEEKCELNSEGVEECKKITKTINKTSEEIIGYEIEEGRSLGGMISVLTKASQQIAEEVDVLKEEVSKIEKASPESKENLIVDKDSVGQAIILSGETEVKIIFENEYASEPIITITPVGLYKMNYGVSDVSAKSFKILIDEKQKEDVIFNWHAFATNKKVISEKQVVKEEKVIAEPEEIEEELNSADVLNAIGEVKTIEKPVKKEPVKEEVVEETVIEEEIIETPKEVIEEVPENKSVKTKEEIKKELKDMLLNALE